MDILRLFVLFICHILAWIGFAMMLYLANYLMVGSNILSIFNQHKILFIYMGIVSPMISYVLHVIYAERGWTNVKAILWIHSMGVIITGIIILIFFNL